MDNSAPRRVEHTSPLYRLLAVVLISVCVVLLGFYLQRVGHADDFGTVAVVVLFFTVRHWARRRPDQMRARFGPFSEIAEAVRNSEQRIRDWTYDRPLRVGALLALVYGIALVISKSVIVVALSALYSWELAAAAGAMIGAVAAAPHLFTSLVRRLVEGSKPEDPPPGPPPDDPGEPGGWYDRPESDDPERP